MDADAARRRLEETTRYEPAEVEGRILERWLEGGLLPPAGRGHAGGELLDRDPAAERDRGAAHGPRAERLDPGRAGPDEPDAGAQHALGARHRPRRDRHPGGGREGACATRGSRATSSAARRSSSGSGSGGSEYGSTDRRAVQAARRLLRLRARALHARRAATCAPSTGSSSALYEKGYIYRDNYMVNWDPGSRSAISDLEVENREVDGHPLLDRLSGRGLGARC